MKKFISLLLSLVCMFSLTGCFSDLSSLFGMGNMEPDKVVPKMQSLLDEAYPDKDMLQFKVEYDEGFQNYVVTCWSSEINDVVVGSVRLAYKNRNIEGASTVIQSWESTTESAKEMSKDIEERIKKYDKDAYVILEFVNADNHEDVLISISGGVVIENIMDI